MPTVEVSNGELVDKLSILAIKRLKITDPIKLNNINKEIDTIKPMGQWIIDFHTNLYLELYSVNLDLWNVEEKLRALEKENNFEKEFIELARSVYKLNDKRAKLKKLINEKTLSSLVEEKSYQ